MLAAIKNRHFTIMIKKVFIGILSILVFSCQKVVNTDNGTNPINKELPKLTTSSVVNISSTTATSGGTIISNGNDSITAKGICWATTPLPTLANFNKLDTGNSLTFTISIQGLTKNITYYVRAYATNSIGTTYGNQISFRTDSTEHVYVTGTLNGRCVYWKDGVLYPLTNSGTFNYALGKSIIVSNNDVYVAGYEYDGNNPFIQAKIWKNGIGVPLASLHSSANAIEIASNDVYVVGEENYSSNSYAAKLWKNGVATTLSTSGTNAHASSIFITENDIYVSGYEESGVNKAGIIWKNGIPTRLFGFCYPGGNGLCTYDATDITDIYVVNNNVYAIGTSIIGTGIYDSILWKNGVATRINILPSSIFVNNNDVYIAGKVGNNACIWKNGIITYLTNGTNQAFATSVYVLGNDVYVTGFERLAGSINEIARVWKNGIAFNLSDGTGSAEPNDIFVQ